MAMVKCKMCGGDLSFVEGSTVCECEYCGSKQTIPGADNEKKTNLFNRANRLRMNSEFDKAAAIYEQLVAEFPEEAEAYWGLCLCNYGIEYVDDPASGKKLPTCHRTLTTSIMEDGNFGQACDFADSIAQKVYREEAKAIDRIQKDILSIAAKEAPYDVFICYKETAEDGGRTKDSVLAQDIYDALTAKGMKVFFSRITLEDKLGVQYEPYIFAALSSAKVMLAVGTAFEYYDAVWVKNEWSRFLSMMKTDKAKTLIPCFKGLDAYDMPKQFKGLQAQDMGKLGWMQDLVRGVEKLCGKGGTASAQPVVQQTVVREMVQNRNTANLMQRVYLFLEDGNWEQAGAYIEKVLDTDAKYAPAYIGRVLIQYKLKEEKALSNLRKPIDSNADWQKAMRFADTQQKQLYDSYANAIKKNEAYDKEQDRIAAEIAAKQKAKEDKYKYGLDLMNKFVWDKAIVVFRALGDYNKSPTNLKKCIDTYRQKLVAKGMSDPALIQAKQRVKQAQSTLKEKQVTVNEVKQEMSAAGQREKQLSDEISRLTTELSQVRGLFSGGKKREFVGKLDDLKRELGSVVHRKQEYEQTWSKAKAELTVAESAVNEALADEAGIEAELRRKELARWNDEAIIAAAMQTAVPLLNSIKPDNRIVSYENAEKMAVFGNSQYLRKDIKKIVFESTATGRNNTAWDISQDSTGTVYAWVDGKSTLHIAPTDNRIVYLPSTCQGLFAGYVNTTEIIFCDCINTSKVTNMRFMFYNCSNLTALDVSGFDTANVTDMRFMFYGCSNLPSLDVSRFATSKVTNMSAMFYNCSNLTALDVSGFDTANVTDMEFMFYASDDHPSKLTSLDVSRFNTSKVTNMKFMFCNCSNLTALDVSGFDTANVTDMAYMFFASNHYPSKLTSLDVSRFVTSKVTNMKAMFYNCSNLTALDVSGFDTANVTDMAFMFLGCGNLTSLDVSRFDTSKVTNMRSMFYNCSNLTALDVSGFDTANVTDMSHMFFASDDHPSKLTSLDVSRFDTSKVSNMRYMFSNCSNLTALDVSGFDTANVTDMAYMFFASDDHPSKLTSLDVSRFNTGKVTNMRAMFYNCSNLKALEVSRFDTSKVTDMRGMFNKCSNLTALDVSRFDTSKVTDMRGMFYKCSNLTALDVSGFDTANVTDMSFMFSGCLNLSVDISNFNMRKVTNKQSMV